MSTKDLLDRLEGLGVGLTAEGDRLRYRAPRGVLTPELRTQIQEGESELLKLLREDEARVHEWGAFGDEDHPHTELVTLYQSATAELNEAWQPEIGPFIGSRYPELQMKAESACKELDRVWRAVVDGNTEVGDFVGAVSSWRDPHLEQIRTFRQECLTWDVSPRVWLFERTPKGILGRRADGRKTAYWAKGEGP